MSAPTPSTPSITTPSERKPSTSSSIWPRSFPRLFRPLSSSSTTTPDPSAPASPPIRTYTPRYASRSMLQSLAVQDRDDVVAQVETIKKRQDVLNETGFADVVDRKGASAVYSFEAVVARAVARQRERERVALETARSRNVTGGRVKGVMGAHPNVELALKTTGGVVVGKAAKREKGKGNVVENAEAKKAIPVRGVAAVTPMKTSVPVTPAAALETPTPKAEESLNPPSSLHLNIGTTQCLPALNSATGISSAATEVSSTPSSLQPPPLSRSSPLETSSSSEAWTPEPLHQASQTSLAGSNTTDVGRNLAAVSRKLSGRAVTLKCASFVSAEDGELQGDDDEEGKVWCDAEEETYDGRGRSRDDRWLQEARAHLAWAEVEEYA